MRKSSYISIVCFFLSSVSIVAIPFLEVDENGIVKGTPVALVFWIGLILGVLVQVFAKIFSQIFAKRAPNISAKKPFGKYSKFQVKYVFLVSFIIFAGLFYPALMFSFSVQLLLPIDIALALFSIEIFGVLIFE